MQDLHLEKSNKVEVLTQEVLKSYDKLTITVDNVNPVRTTLTSIPNLRVSEHKSYYHIFLNLHNI